MELKELRTNGEKFPLDVAAVPTAFEGTRGPETPLPSAEPSTKISAHDFLRDAAEPASPIAPKVSAYDFSRGYSAAIHFGIGSVPAALRALADKIESKQILPQRSQVTTEARHDDYTKSALLFEYIETNRELPACPECACSS